MTHLHLDFETYSEVDIKRAGAYKYAMHPSTEALMLGFAHGSMAPQVWDITQRKDMPEFLAACLHDPDTLIFAFNATFERLILKYCLYIDIPPERFRCVQVRGYGLAFTGSLDNMATQFNLGITKDPRGQALINRFSKPQPANHKVRRWTAENDPEGWEEFKSYCAQDVEVERKLWKKCEPYHFPEHEWSNYALSERINDRGVPVDQTLIQAALATADQERRQLIADMKVLMPGVDNPNSRDQLLDWLKTQSCMIFDVKAETIARALKKWDGQEPVASVLKLKQQLAKTSVTKWKAFDRMICPDGRVHGMFQFGGASRTMRWAGRGVQLQNLPRGGNTTKVPETAADIMAAGGHTAVKCIYGDPMMLLSDTIRCAITAPHGAILNVSDLGSIESRVLGWMSGCQEINDTFARQQDTYRRFAMRLYQAAYDEVTKEQRNFCKPPVLGCGYKLGADGLVAYAASMGVTLSREQAVLMVKVWREAHPEVVEFWNWCKTAVFYTTQTGGEYPGPYGMKTFAHGEFLCLRLPSGRNLYYYRPKILRLPAPWDRTQLIEQFTYYGTDRYKNNKWRRIKAHEGGITENIDQAISRDILTEWQRRADAAGFNIVLHVHDEIGCTEQTDRLAELNELIRRPISWAPGLLLDADGYTARRYKKD